MRTNVAPWRRWLGLSQDEFAEMVGMSKMGFAEMERGETQPRPSTLATIARVLGVSRTTLLHGSPEEEWEHGWRPPSHVESDPNANWTWLTVPAPGGVGGIGEATCC
jgi:transcriptional regulator with XRE-family HTH domain